MTVAVKLLVPVCQNQAWWQFSHEVNAHQIEMVHLLRVHGAVQRVGGGGSTAWRGSCRVVAARRGHRRRHELFWTRSPSKPPVYGCKLTGLDDALVLYGTTAVAAVAAASRRRQTNAATNTPPPPPRLCWSVLEHTSDQRSHADFPSLPDASSHSSFIFFFDFTFTHIPIAIPQYIYLEQ